MKRTVAGVADAWSAGLRPIKINIPIYHSSRRGLGNLYELPDILTFAAEQHVSEVRVFTLLSHENFPVFQEYYHFFSRSTMDSIAQCLDRFGVDSIDETVTALARLGADFSTQAYPKIEFGVDLGPVRLAFESMRLRRLGDTLGDQEGPYAIRVAADGGFRSVLDGRPDYSFVDAMRTGSPNEELSRIYRAAQEAMP